MVPRCCAPRFFRWVPGLVLLGLKKPSLHSPGTRARCAPRQLVGNAAAITPARSR